MDDQLIANRQLAISNRQIGLLIAYCLLLTAYSFSQNYTRVDTIPVKISGNWLQYPWVGGHNYCQFSDIDMNFDGIKDLFVFDRTGHKVTTYINHGTPNTVDYTHDPQYESKFPHLEDWVLIRDYNGDGKPDIFTYAITVGGIKVWKNTSSAGNLQFTLQTPYIKSDYTPSNTSDPLTNLYVSRVDIPTIDDVDGDGDLDVLTFEISSNTQMEYHINQSVEKGYGQDSLIFNLDVAGGCWGNFSEDPFLCNVYLASCRMMNPDSIQHTHPFTSPFTREEEWEYSLQNHAGNTSLSLDMDADGDKDILLGQIGCCNLALLTNGGSKASANMISKDTLFPSNAIPVRLTEFPSSYFIDVDNDNKRDLIVAPNSPNVSVDNESIWYYKNTGADNAPIFSRKSKSFLQQDMIDVGQGADPVFFDFDQDGLTDILISNYSMTHDTCPASYMYGVWAFRNIGTATDPRFDLVTKDYDSLSVKLKALNPPNSPLYSKHLTFGDLDADGDLDMIVGDHNGNISYFTNTAGTAATCSFVLTEQNMLDDNSTVIDIGSYATPQLADVDRDGDLDLIIGERSGNLNFYENIGTASSATFTLTSNTFGGVNVFKAGFTGYSIPFLYDSAGSYRMIVGSTSNRTYPYTGWLWYFDNIDGNVNGNFNRVDSMYKNIWEGGRMAVNGHDINGDGAMDLVIGNDCGGVAIYMGDSNTVSVPELITSSFDFTVYPNPSYGYAFVDIVHFAADEKYRLTIYNSIGEVVHIQSLTHAQTRMDKHFTAGIYSYQVSSENVSKTKRLVVLK